MSAPFLPLVCKGKKDSTCQQGWSCRVSYISNCPHNSSFQLGEDGRSRRYELGCKVQFQPQICSPVHPHTHSRVHCRKQGGNNHRSCCGVGEGNSSGNPQKSSCRHHFEEQGGQHFSPHAETVSASPSNASGSTLGLPHYRRWESLHLYTKAKMVDTHTITFPTHQQQNAKQIKTKVPIFFSRNQA